MSGEMNVIVCGRDEAGPLAGWSLDGSSDGLSPDGQDEAISVDGVPSAPLPEPPGGAPIPGLLAELSDGRLTVAWPLDSGPIRVGMLTAENGTAVVIASRPSGAAGHGDEPTAGWRLGAEGAVAFDEALVSTEFDGSGAQTRLGLELWPLGDLELPMRGAATTLAAQGTPQGLLALLQGSINGSPAAGAYLIGARAG